MIKGVDTASNVTGIAQQLKNSGYQFVIRYYSLAANAKRMTAAESAAINAAGLKRVVVYQNLHNAYAKFSESIARNDAADAIAQAKALGQPSGTIYFAVDYDASESEVNGNITAHFRVLQNLLSQAGYGVGVYGSGLVCRKLKENLSISRTWLAMSTSWREYNIYTSWNIRQTTQKTISGIVVDEDEAASIYDIGAW